jgi:hypothetical protein
LGLSESASAQKAFTISKPVTTTSTRALPSAEETMHRYRRTSSQDELVFRRAAKAAQLREARIQSRRRHNYSASRPNMVFDRPLNEWYGAWWPPYIATYYRRAN